MLYGLQSLTLLDYPGYVAATVFLKNCNFRCPFCHNKELVIPSGQEDMFSEPYMFSEEEILSFLQKRKRVLDGVCISGGEPTLYRDLPSFLEKIKALGMRIKLDTNGSNPQMIRQLHASNLLDYVAMDIKSSPEHYKKVVGSVPFSMEDIQSSVTYLMTSGLDYEFRTTVVRELHSQEDFVSISHWIAGCRAYCLQAYRDSDTVLQPGFSSYRKSELEAFRTILLKKIPLVELRGVNE